MTSWKLSDDVAEATQGYVASGFGRLGSGEGLFVRLTGTGGSWLAALQEIAPATPAIKIGGNPALERVIAIAFTYSGLKKMGMPPTALASFSSPFREGMFQEDRLRRLGDRRSGAWLDTVRPEGPTWSGNITPEKSVAPVGAYDVALQDEAKNVSTPETVHAVVLVYTDAPPDLSEIKAVLAAHGVQIVHRLPLFMDPDSHTNISKEHFGFADGISQPVPYDKQGAILREGKAMTAALNTVHGVPLGDFLIGYENGHQEVAPGPVVPDVVEGAPDPRPGNAGLPAHEKARGFFDFGRNGSYLVIRELHQNVAAFWQSMEAAAELIRANDPEAVHVTPDWIAEKVVGRSLDGHVLTPDGPKPPRPGEGPENDFSFWDADHDGLGCPLGSHIRRAYPRDALAPMSSMKEALLGSANNHRILRRGRKYGTNLARGLPDDGEDRGLLFMCLNTDIARQFEFVQQTWLFNSDFGTLFEEVDPLIGRNGEMTIPELPLRRRVHVETFVQMAGGEYFFLPSIPAIRYLAQL